MVSVVRPDRARLRQVPQQPPKLLGAQSRAARQRRRTKITSGQCPDYALRLRADERPVPSDTCQLVRRGEVHAVADVTGAEVTGSREHTDMMPHGTPGETKAPTQLHLVDPWPGQDYFQGSTRVRIEQASHD